MDTTTSPSSSRVSPSTSPKGTTAFGFKPVSTPLDGSGYPVPPPPPPAPSSPQPDIEFHTKCFIHTDPDPEPTLRDILSLLDKYQPTVQWIMHSPDAVVPKCAAETAPGHQNSGHDLIVPHDVVVPPMGSKATIIDFGVGAKLPPGYDAYLAPRSSTATRYGILTAFGILDNPYRGSYKVAVFNQTNEEVVIPKGASICQVVFNEIALVRTESTPIVAYGPHANTEVLTETTRGTGGFGSTDA